MTAHAESASGLAHIHMERFAEAIDRCENSFRINQSLGREHIAAYALLNKAQALAHLGQFKQAREALSQTFKTAEKSRDKQLVAWVHLMLARTAFFEGRFDETAVENQKSLQTSGEQVQEIVISANTTMALAKLSGNLPAQADGYFRIADQTVKQIENSRLNPEVKIVQAELFLKEKNSAQSLQEALQARAAFAEQQAKYSEWRALAIAAAASLLAGDSSGAKEYAQQSESISALLEQSWGADNFRSFKNRSDTIYYQSLIDKALSEK